MIYFRPILLIFFLLPGLLTAAFAIPLTIQVQGIQKQMKTNVENKLQNIEGKLPKPLSLDTIKNFSRTSTEDVQKALEPYGYFKSQIASHLYVQPDQAVIVFNINPGPAMPVSQIRVNITGPAENDPAFLNYIRKFPLKEGKPLNAETYEKAKQGLIDLANDRGYFEAKMVQSRLIINLNTYEAQVCIDFNSGPRYFFGPTTFQPSPFALSFLERFLTYHQGEYYDAKKLDATQQGLTNSNYFQEALVNPLRNQTVNHQVPINILLIPRKPIQYIFGLGFGTDTGPRVTLGLSLRRINAYGHRLFFLMRASARDSQAVANYIIPGFRPAKDQILLSAGLGRLSQVTGNSYSGKGAITYITSLWDINQSLALIYLNEKYEFTRPFRLWNHAQFVYGNGNWDLLETDNIWNPTRGFRITANLAGTPRLHTTLGNDSFFQYRIDAKGLYTFPTNTRLKGRLSFGHTQIHHLVNLPLSLQFFAGGAVSVRGFQYNQIGPGRNLFVGSLEVQQRIKDSIYLGAFVDVGNVANFNPLRDLNVGVGPAVIWLSPVGSLEISLAKPLHISRNLRNPRPRREWMVEFTMGTEL